MSTTSMHRRPPAGGGDVVTQHDVRLRDAQLRTEIAALRTQFLDELTEVRREQLRASIRVQAATYIGANVLLGLVVAAVLLAAVR